MPRKKWNFEETALTLLLPAFAALVVVLNKATPPDNQQFAWLADSFIHGKPYFGDAVAAMRQALLDATPYDGHLYWPLGPLPAVLLMPMVLFAAAAPGQIMLQLFCVAALYAAAWSLARRRNFSPTNAHWCAIAYCFGSVAAGVVYTALPWQLANTLATALVMAAVLEFTGANRPWAIGSWIGLATMSRITAGISLLFFAINALTNPGPAAAKLRRLAAMVVPFACALVILSGYNFWRFGDFMNSGQRDHFLTAGTVEAEQRDRYGLFDPVNIPRNFYYYFLKLPDLRGWLPVVNPYGVSFFILSPAFFWLVLAGRRYRLAAIVTAAAALSVFLSYFGTGYWQFGPRYLLDFLPIFYLLLIDVWRKHGFGRTQKIVIGASAVMNAVLYVIFIYRT